MSSGDRDLRPALEGSRPEHDVDAWEGEGGEVLSYRLSKDAALRLDLYVQNRIKGFSRNQVQKLIGLGAVTVNGKEAKPSLKLKEGDVVEIRTPPKPGKEIRPQAMDLDVLYEDDDLIVLNKRAGVVVHPARAYLSGTLLNGLAHHFLVTGQATEVTVEAGEAGGDDEEDVTLVPGLSTVGGHEARPGVVHRLDKNTTGVIVFAKRDASHWLISRQFEKRTNLKVYLAVVHGSPEHEAGVIDHPIGKHPTIKEAYCIQAEPHGKPSLTLYRVRERYQGYSLVELELKTGRTHQIRVHLSYLGHPIVGDLLYGGEPVGLAELDAPPVAAGFRPYVNYARPKEEGQKMETEAAEREDLVICHPALHATLLGIRQPTTDRPMRFTAPVHEPMRRLIGMLRERPAQGKVVSRGAHVDLDEAVPVEG
ncbi:RluA family pseudouridine synthase [Mucisphaera sp.]|uniref:RluA family pseudouridine synthase n=1 Tax=Mucisphaera sp. TaxID=2913024 RepID=UPI003D0C78DF